MANSKNFFTEFNYSEFLNILLIKKKLVLYITASFSLFSILYSLSLNNIYTSQTLFVPTGLSQAKNPLYQQTTSSLLGSIGLAGPNIDVNTAIEFVKSKRLVGQLMKYESFLPDLMAAKK